MCGRISTTFAIFRQKSGRGFLRFSLSLALFPPFPFFRLSLFSAFPSFPRFFKKQKPLRRREAQYTKVFPTLLWLVHDALHPFNRLLFEKSQTGDENSRIFLQAIILNKIAANEIITTNSIYYAYILRDLALLLKL